MNKMDVFLSLSLLALFSFSSHTTAQSKSQKLGSCKKITSTRPVKKRPVKKRPVKKRPVKKGPVKKTKKVAQTQAPDKNPKGNLVVIASKKAFEKLLASGKPMIVGVFIPGCDACKVVAPKIKLLAKKRNDVIVAKVDANKLNFIRSKYKLTTFPTFLYFKNGKLVSKMVGVNRVAGFEKQLKRKLGV